MPQLYKNDQVK